MRRLVAVLGAVLMVVVAVLVRGVLDGDDAGSADGGDEGRSDGEVSLLCADELEAVCRALRDDGEIADYALEAAGDTVDRMTVDGEDLGADGWLTVDPFPELTEVGRGVANLGRLFGEPAATGRTTGLAVAVDPDRTVALINACDDEVTWPCLGELAGDRWSTHGGEAAWGPVTVGVEGPDSATGLLTTTQAAAAHLDLPDFATNDLQSGEVFRWLGRFEPGLDVAGTMVLRPGSFSAVATLEVEAERLAGTAQGEGLGIFYPAPMYRAEVVVVAPRADADGLIGDEALDEALDEAGWGTERGEPLPGAGAVYALRERL